MIQLTDLIVTVAQEADDALTRLAKAVEMSGQLNELGDHLIGHFVDEARRGGASWAEIGESLGVTKQAAQKRFVPRESPDLGKPSMDRYTQRSRRVIALARHHARFSERIGTEHLLLGLLDESGGLAAKTIAKLEAGDGSTRIAVLNRLDTEAKQRPEKQPFTAHCKKALELTVREALRMGHMFIGTEHILLGLLLEEDGTAADVLHNTGVSHAAAAAHIEAVVNQAAPARPGPNQAAPIQAAPNQATPSPAVLDQPTNSQAATGQATISQDPNSQAMTGQAMTGQTMTSQEGPAQAVVARAELTQPVVSGPRRELPGA